MRALRTTKAGGRHVADIVEFAERPAVEPRESQAWEENVFYFLFMPRIAVGSNAFVGRSRYAAEKKLK